MEIKEEIPRKFLKFQMNKISHKNDFKRPELTKENILTNLGYCKGFKWLNNKNKCI